MEIVEQVVDETIWARRLNYLITVASKRPCHQQMTVMTDI